MKNKILFSVDRVFPRAGCIAVFCVLFLPARGTQGAPALSLPVQALLAVLLVLTAALVVWHGLTRYRQLHSSEEKYRQVVETSQEGIIILQEDQIVFANQRVADISGYSLDEIRGKPYAAFIHPDDLPYMSDMLRRYRDGNIRSQTMAFRILTRRGDVCYVMVRSSHMHWEGRAAILNMVIDITEQRRVETELRSSEERYRRFYESSVLGIFRTSLEGKLLHANPALVRMFGFADLEEARQEWDFRKNYVNPEDRTRLTEGTSQPGGMAAVEVPFRRADGGEFWANVHMWRVLDRAGVFQYFEGFAEDITRRKEAERAVRQSESRFAAAFHTSPDSININRLVDGVYLEINEGFTHLTGYTREDVIGKSSLEINIWDNPEDRARLVKGLLEKGEVIELEALFRLKDGRKHIALMSARVLDINNEKCILSVTRDIHDRRMAEEKIRQQLERLAGLRQIDQAIVGLLELEPMLDILVELIRKLLSVDAVCIMLLDDAGERLVSSSQVGYRNGQRFALPRGRTFAWRAVEERRMIFSNNFPAEHDYMHNTLSMREEGFLLYVGAPLITHGQVKGVLEICSRASLDPDQDWMDYVEALAGQAAIAVHTAGLFNRLQEANQDLVEAYDATIQALAQAVELRDGETGNHSQRVADQAVQLGAALGMDEEQLKQLRRGALLHDIGKIAVPDAVLSKPGKLTDEEMDVMRQHPAHALQILSPIDFLRPALDVPGYHHEKWDGTGYPRGLAAEEIPLAARVFAVVDVWDALLSDRPYRKAWERRDVERYLQEQAGFHFDPLVVEAFLDQMAGQDGR